MNNHNSSILKYLGVVIGSLLLVSQLVSCGKDNTTSLGTDNGYLNIVNLSPNINPVNLYAEYIKQGTTQYRYPNASGYFLMNINDTPLQVRPALSTTSSQINLISLPGSLKKNVRYTWFLTGLRSDSSLTYIFTVDSGATPAIGRSKVRLVNASPGSLGINVTANDSELFSKIAYKGVSDYREVTSGSYNFKISATNAPGVILTTLKNTTVLDGKLYTIYAYGLPNRTDTAAFSAGIILNTIPDKN
ncbi:DUF4397 domain-containing protein [Mucilaginibacter psychrotolerans]|uniref:DUF4397 domain-containing protein n=1 Tax=Mucilaginibacter psychrotolerans TaxID=1524096 RepID=A0A4Y8S8I8_9SPHI|nr:DUF4397 domain-containing protein [Mucilaginibacter psychrotolerans]TFF34945.1 DUF4397 domain-containing protein [Mucilaginibacter psychrotolerans]